MAARVLAGAILVFFDLVLLGWLRDRLSGLGAGLRLGGLGAVVATDDDDERAGEGEDSEEGAKARGHGGSPWGGPGVGDRSWGRVCSLAVARG
jgi:hypothetical protein